MPGKKQPFTIPQCSLFFILFLMLGIAAVAQAPVTIPIETSRQVLLLQTDTSHRLGIVYFGNRLEQPAEYALVAKANAEADDNAGIFNGAYTPAGTWNLVEPAIQVKHADGNASLELVYVSHATKKISEGVTETSIELKDPVYPVQVTLHYKAYFNENVLAQWVVIRHQEKKPIVLEKYASANLYFRNDRYFLTHYHGAWGHEMNPEETELTHGIQVIDSKLGTRANLFEPPSFMVSFDRLATEDEGKVLLGTLGWSGNFKIELEMDAYHHLRLLAGINPYASAYTLAAAQSFTTPPFFFTYSTHGKGEASRNLHRWARKYQLADGQGQRLTLLNNWEATHFDFNEQQLTGLFAGAKKLGVDLFLLDDGWFGNKHPRNEDTAGLGDWQENVQKLPHGIGYLVKQARQAGIRFGIWVEPEMVNPQSELYEQHRDWVIRQPARPEHYFRNQLVLDLSNPAVQDFVYGILDNLFTQNPDLAFIKWDCNAVIYDAYSQYLQKTGQAQSQLYVDYVKGLYTVLERLRAKYPKVPMMLCSGGGGRVDYQALHYFTEFWPSDNTDPLERIFIQWEYSYFYPAIAHCNHVTDWGKQPLKYRTDVAMMGKMGYDIVTNELNATDLAFSQQALRWYQSISDVVWHGDLYRLVNPREQPFASLLFVDEPKSRAVVFNYLASTRFLRNINAAPVRLKGLDAAKRYTVKEINLYPGTHSALDGSTIYSGDYLMNIGFNPGLSASRSSVVVEVNEVK